MDWERPVSQLTPSNYLTGSSRWYVTCNLGETNKSIEGFWCLLLFSREGWREYSINSTHERPRPRPQLNSTQPVIAAFQERIQTWPHPKKRNGAEKSCASIFSPSSNPRDTQLVCGGVVSRFWGVTHWIRHIFLAYGIQWEIDGYPWACRIALNNKTDLY